MCVTHTHPLDEVTPLEPTMLPTGAIDCLTKTLVAGMKKTPLRWLVRVLQVTPKIIGYCYCLLLPLRGRKQVPIAEDSTPFKQDLEESSWI